MLGAPSFARTTILLTERARVVVLHDAGNKSEKIWMTGAFISTNKDLDLGVAKEKEYTEQYHQSVQPSRGAY